MTESIPRHINDVMTACRGSGSQCHAQIANYACSLCRYSGGIAPVSTGVSTVNVRIPSDAEVNSLVDQSSPLQNGWHFSDSQNSPLQNGWHPELMPSGMGCKTSKDKCFISEWHPAMVRSGLSSPSAPIISFQIEEIDDSHKNESMIFLDEDLMF